MSFQDAVGRIETEFTGLREVADGSVLLFQCHSRQATVEIDFGQIGIQLNGSRIILNGMLIFQTLHIGIATVKYTGEPTLLCNFGSVSTMARAALLRLS